MKKTELKSLLVEREWILIWLKTMAKTIESYNVKEIREQLNAIIEKIGDEKNGK